MRTILAAVVVSVAATASQPAAAQSTAMKYAVLIGVNEYDHPKLAPLKYAVNDVTELRDVLDKHGYVVTLLTAAAKTDDRKPTKKNIDEAVKAVLAKCGKRDSVLVGMAGHGLQFEGRRTATIARSTGSRSPTSPTRWCRSGTVRRDGPEQRRDQGGAGRRLSGRPGRGRGIDADTSKRPPRGVAALFSCSAGERAFENDTLKHGVFFHHVIKGLNGDAADKKGRVTFAGLASYVSTEVAETVPGLVGGGVRQSPNLKAEYSNEPTILRSHVTVDPDPSKGDFTSVVDAVASPVTTPGVVIKVRPGTYTGTVEIQRSTQIVGDGAADKIVIVSDDNAAVRLGLEIEVTIKGVTLRCQGGEEAKQGGIANWGGKLLLEDCAVTSNSRSCAFVNTNADSTFRRCKFHGGPQCGVLMYDGSRAGFEDCEFSGNEMIGLEVRGGAKATLTKCRLKENAGAGLYAHDKGEITATDCDIAENKQAGASVGTDGKLTLTNCRVTKNTGAGVRVGKDGTATLTGCTLDDNDGGRINAEDGSDVTERAKQ